MPAEVATIPGFGGLPWNFLAETEGSLWTETYAADLTWKPKDVESMMQEIDQWIKGINLLTCVFAILNARKAIGRPGFIVRLMTPKSWPSSKLHLRA